MSSVAAAIKNDWQGGSVNAQADTSPWMETNLPWVAPFWSNMDAMKTMRLNPHWHIEEGETSYEVEDLIAEAEFNTSVSVHADVDSWHAEFPGLGLTLHARPDSNNNLEFSFTQTGEEVIDQEKLELSLRYWLPSMREYARLYAEDTIKTRCWRWFMNKVMLKMNPTQRRICMFMFKLTLLEMLLIVILGVGFYFYNGW